MGKYGENNTLADMSVEKLVNSVATRFPELEMYVS